MKRILRQSLENGRFSYVSVQTSTVMAQIKSKANKTTEVALRLGLIRAGIRGWKLHEKKVLGCPDFFFEREKVAVFVHGCFWHGCDACQNGHIPKTRSDFWREKIADNKSRDAFVTQGLKQIGITVLTFWEHQIRHELPNIICSIKDTLSHYENLR